jgi:hypothetical protein
MISYIILIVTTKKSVVLVFAGYHIYLGSLLPEPFLMYYISGLMIPIAILASSFALSKEVNTNWCRPKFYTWKNNKKQQEQQQSDEATSLINQQQQQTIENPYSKQISIHLHHWQIFYILAFFTR